MSTKIYSRGNEVMLTRFIGPRSLGEDRACAQITALDFEGRYLRTRLCRKDAIDVARAILKEFAPPPKRRRWWLVFQHAHGVHTRYLETAEPWTSERIDEVQNSVQEDLSGTYGWTEVALVNLVDLGGAERDALNTGPGYIKVQLY